MTYPASKVVIITEKVIEEQVVALIEAEGASGYTLMETGGKGSRNKRSSGRAAVGERTNIRIEVIMANQAKALELAELVAQNFFNNYSGITYLMPVDIIRLEKFNP